MSKIRNKKFWQRIKPELAPGESRSVKLFQGESIRRRIQPTHRVAWVKTFRKSRSGVEHFFYQPRVIPV
ncbi:MAG: hypothetical protein WC767_03670 [Candidatus Paceibacterota bacterium]